MKVYLTMLFTVAFAVSNAQFDPDYKLEDDAEYESSPVNLGVGLGLSYGGIGGRVAVFPVPMAGVFGAVGYNFHKAGYNVGGILRILPKKKFCPLLIGMYGYNGVVVIQGLSDYDKTYYGPTFGGGAEIRFSNGQNFLNLELLVPLRSEEWYDDIDMLLHDPNIEMTEPLPIAVSIGYHIKF